MGEAKRRQQTGQPSLLARKNQKQRWIGGTLVIIGLIAVISAVYWLSNPRLMQPSGLPTAEGRDNFPANHDRLGVQLGDSGAPIVVREFADYECPACKRFSSAVDKLKAEYIDKGRVRYVFFDLPLRQHDNAVPAAQAARCAEDQGAWWPMHRKLFAEQSSWNTASDPEAVFTRYAGSLDLDQRRFGRCLSADIHLGEIDRNRNLARQLGITGTPTVLVDNIPLNRTNWAQLSAVIERELKREDGSERAQ